MYRSSSVFVNLTTPPSRSAQIFPARISSSSLRGDVPRNPAASLRFRSPPLDAAICGVCVGMRLTVITRLLACNQSLSHGLVTARNHMVVFSQPGRNLQQNHSRMGLSACLKSCDSV